MARKGWQWSTHSRYYGPLKYHKMPVKRNKFTNEVVNMSNKVILYFIKLKAIAKYWPLIFILSSPNLTPHTIHTQRFFVLTGNSICLHRSMWMLKVVVTNNYFAIYHSVNCYFVLDLIFSLHYYFVDIKDAD